MRPRVNMPRKPIVFGQKKFGQTIPFGPFLSLASLITLFWGTQIIGWYLRLRG